MTALKIKNELLRIIINTDDVEVLSQITNYAHSIQNDDGFKLTEEQLKQIEQSEEDIRLRRVYTREEARAKNKAFLEKRRLENK